MKNLLTVFLLFSIGILHSQDQLFKKDNTKIEVKILEINPTEIKYKLFTYPDGPTIIIAKSDVALIIYQNGAHEVFNEKPTIKTEGQTVIVYTGEPKTTQDDQKAEKEAFDQLVSTKNLVSLNIMEPLNGTFSVNYLREFANHYLNVYVPFSTGFTEPYMNQTSFSIFNTYRYNFTNITNFKFTRKAAESGIGIHFQTSGKKAVTHFVGPYFGMAQYNGTFDEVFYNNSSMVYQPPTTVSHSFVMNRYYVMINNGILFRVTSNFNIILMAAFGYHVDTFVANDPKSFYDPNQYYGGYPSQNTFPINAMKLGLSFGYRF